VINDELHVGEWDRDGNRNPCLLDGTGAPWGDMEPETGSVLLPGGDERLSWGLTGQGQMRRK